MDDVLLRCSLLLLVTVLSHSHTHPLTHSVSSLNHDLLFANCLLPRLSTFHSVAKLSTQPILLSASREFWGSGDDSGEGRNTWGVERGGGG